MPRIPIIALTLVMATACSDGNDNRVETGPPNPFEGFSSDIYSDLGNWLCHPSLASTEDICDRDLDATIVYADGSQELEDHVPATDPLVDCFYVYPTVSSDPGGNADLDEGQEEIFTTLNQGARYSRFCRVFAPVYRQGTLAAIFEEDVERDPELAYGDVLDSFREYMATENQGRGYILVGHSQGSGHLRRLIAETVEEDEYLLGHLVAAHLLGSTVRTPEGADVGADFDRVPVCRTRDQVACVVSYATYREGDPFLAADEGIFGQPGEEGPAVCTHPAALGGGSAIMDPYFPVENLPLLEAVIIPRVDGPYADPDSAPPIATPFYRMPDFIRAQCLVDGNGYSYLEAVAIADSTDPRADDFNGEFIGGDGWGLHLVDVTIGMGDLVDLGADQATAWFQDR